MSLPLKAKVSIRDLWEDPQAPAQTAIKKVKETLGIDVNCQPEWRILITDLEKTYSDRAQLIAFVVGSLQVWFETLAALLEDTSLDPWSELLLGRIYEVSTKLNVTVEVCDRNTASTHFSETHRGFVVSLPNVEIHQPAQFALAFKDQILDSAEDNPSKGPPVVVGGGDWAYIATEPVKEPTTRSTAPTHTVPEVEYLPDPQALPKPGTLLLKPPYHLFVHAIANNHLDVQCSHTPTLDVLCAYLKRWCRVNPSITDNPPAMSIEQNTATCSFDLVYDTLTLSSRARYGNYFTISPTLILTLVEGVLGYKRVYGDATTWQYRKDTPFKSV